MKKKIQILCLIIFVFILSSCTNLNTTQIPTSQYVSNNQEIAYPSAVVIIEENEYGYPITEETLDLPRGPEFNINTPVSTNDQLIQGTGPADVPIKLVSVSDVGLVLGETVIDKEGNFIFTLSDNLTTGQTIGIQVGDLAGTNFNETDFLYSPTYYERPFIGILQDMVVVE